VVIGLGFSLPESMSEIIALRPAIPLLKAWCFALLTALIALTPLIGAAGESNMVRVQFREVFARWCGSRRGQSSRRLDSAF
jgi:hypothetical protein